MRSLLAVAAIVLLAAGCTGATSSATSSPSASPAASASAAPSTAPCHCVPASGPDAGPADLTIYGAASLKGALDQLKSAYEAGHPGVHLTISTDSSAALETQIEQGAPADVLLSADVTNPKRLVDAGLADGEAVDFAGNLLTVIVPAANPAGIAGPADLAKPGVKIIAAGADVPITKYADQVVGLLAKLDGYPAGFAAAYAANVVSKEDNVKAIVAKIELGEGDAGIVYVTDAKASGKVSAIPIPTEANVPATYAGVVVKSTVHAAAAHQFLTWMTGAEAQLVLTELGFIQPQT